MFRRSIVIVGVIVVLVAGALALLWQAPDSSSSYEYAEYADITRDSSVHAATIPDFVPRSARDIAGRYNVEFNDQILEFTFDLQDQGSLTSTFQAAAGDQARKILEQMDGYRWKNEFPPEASARTYHREKSEDREFLVIDARNSRAFYASEKR